MIRLRELRKARHLTQEQLAEKFGVQKITISRYENGEREPTFETLNGLASFFGVTVDYLLGRTDEPNVTTKTLEVLDSMIAQQKSSPWGSNEEDEKEFERIRQAYAKATPEQREEFAKIFERYVEGEDK